MLLVTSADHMRRAMAAFRKAGITRNGRARPTFSATRRLYDSVLDFLPNADALAETSHRPRR